MWWLLVIIIVLFIITKFTRDLNKQANAVAKQGGMRNKYRTLVEYAISGHPQSKTVHEDGTSIDIGCSTPGGSTNFSIIQTFGSVTIRWSQNSALIGKHKLEWQFDEFYNQELMTTRGNTDHGSLFSANRYAYQSYICAKRHEFQKTSRHKGGTGTRHRPPGCRPHFGGLPCRHYPGENS